MPEFSLTDLAAALKDAPQKNGLSLADLVSRPRGDASQQGRGISLADLANTWPARLLQSLYGGVMAPGDAWNGSLPMIGPDGHTNPEAISRAADLAGVVMGGTYAGAPSGALGAGAVQRARSLPMDEASRMARAKETGFTTEAYHGTRSDFPAFERVEGGNLWGNGHYFTTSPEAASRYATGDVNRISPSGNADPNVMPVMLRAERPFALDEPITESTWRAVRKGLIAEGVPPKDIFDTRRHLLEMAQLDRRRGGTPTNQGLVEAASYETSLDQEGLNRALRHSGFDAITSPGGVAGDGAGGRQIMVFEPNQIRSRFAAFDPSKASLSDILAGLTAVPAAGAVGAAMNEQR